MNVAELSHVETAYDKVGLYDQDAINGFSEQMLHAMLDLVNPSQASDILDAMAGNGNLTLRLYDYCRRCEIPFPNIVLLELSRVQCELARIIGKYLSGYPILAVVSKRCIISEFKDRFESESGAPGSFITPRMSPLGVGP